MARGGPSEETYTPQVQPEDLPRKIVPRDEGISAAPAFAQAAEASEAKYKADSVTFAGTQLAQLRQQALQSLDQAKQAVPVDPNDPDAIKKIDGFTGNYLTQFDKQSATYTSNTAIQNNPFASRMINNGISELRDTLQTHTMEWQANQAVAYRSNAFDAAVKTQSAIVEAHPEMAGQIGATLSDQANGIGGDPAARLTRMRQMHDALTLASANGLTRQDPRGMLLALKDPENAPANLKPVISDLSDAQREAIRAKANEHMGDTIYTALENKNFRGAQLALNKNEDILDPKVAETLQRTINGQVEMARTMADRAQKDASDSLLKNAILMQKNGQLTPAYIEKYHNTWEPAAYEYAYKLLSGKENQTDPHVFAPLLQRSLEGEDVTKEAEQQFYSGNLTQSDYTKIVEKSDLPRGNFVKNGSQYIEQALKPSPLLYKPDAALDYANAMDDFHAWLKDNPKASSDQGMNEARRIAQNYAFVQADKAITFGPVPVYLKGTRQVPDIGATFEATRQAHDSGQMSDSEFARQSALILTWQSYTNQQAANKAKTQQKPP